MAAMSFDTARAAWRALRDATVSQFRAAALANYAYLSVPVTQHDRQVTLACLEAGEFYPEWTFYEGTQTIEVVAGACVVTVDARAYVASAGSTVFVPRGVACMLAHTADTPAHLYVTSTSPQAFALHLRRQRDAPNGSFSPFTAPINTWLPPSPPSPQPPPPQPSPPIAAHTVPNTLNADYTRRFVRTLFSDDYQDGRWNQSVLDRTGKRLRTVDDMYAAIDHNDADADAEFSDSNDVSADSDDSFIARVLASLPSTPNNARQ